MIEQAVFSDPWSAQAFGDVLARADTVFLVSEAARRITGYAIGVQAADEGEVLNLAVEIQRRREGLGSRLLGALIRALSQRGAGRVFLEVRVSNTSAIALYEGAGFRRIGRRPGYYARPAEDAVTMATEVGDLAQQDGEESREIG